MAVSRSLLKQVILSTFVASSILLSISASVVGATRKTTVVVADLSSVAAEHKSIGIAAVVNGHAITLAEVTDIALREDGANITSKLVDDYLVDQEAKARRITVSPREVDGQIQTLLRLNPGMTLAEGLRRHHETSAQLKDDIRQWCLRCKLVASEVTPGVFVHARVLLIRVGNSGAAANARTDDEALALVRVIQDNLMAGRTFEDLARQYSEDPLTKANGGDAGVLFDHAPADPSVVRASLMLAPGGISAKPVRSSLGYVLIQAISTGDAHAPSEDKMYADAGNDYEMEHAQTLIPAFIQRLRAKARIKDNLPE